MPPYVPRLKQPGAPNEKPPLFPAPTQAPPVSSPHHPLLLRPASLPDLPSSETSVLAPLPRGPGLSFSGPFPTVHPDSSSMTRVLPCSWAMMRLNGPGPQLQPPASQRPCLFLNAHRALGSAALGSLALASGLGGTVFSAQKNPPSGPCSSQRALSPTEALPRSASAHSRASPALTVWRFIPTTITSKLPSGSSPRGQGLGFHGCCLFLQENS